MEVDDELLTVNDVCDILSVSRTVVTGLIARGELEAFRIGRQYRIKRTALDACLEQARVSSDRTEGDQ